MRAACLEGHVGILREGDGGYSLARAVVPAADVAHVSLGRRPHPSVTAYRLYLYTREREKEKEREKMYKIIISRARQFYRHPEDGSIFLPLTHTKHDTHTHARQLIDTYSFIYIRVRLCVIIIYGMVI